MKYELVFRCINDDATAYVKPRKYYRTGNILEAVPVGMVGLHKVDGDRYEQVRICRATKGRDADWEFTGVEN